MQLVDFKTDDKKKKFKVSFFFFFTSTICNVHVIFVL